MTQFDWTSKREKAAVALSSGYTEHEAAEAAGVARSTICRWKNHPEFAAEVDRLSLMVDISGRAERLRLAMRAARQMISDDGTVMTGKDLLDWLKYAQSETDGVKLDLVKLQEAIIDD